MQSGAAYEKLKKIFPEQIENINLFQLHPSEAYRLISNNLPHIPLSRIHSLCRSQEKNVMNKILEVKQMDLYDEMASVCPNKDLKLMRTYSHEEVNQKIHDYSSQIALNEEKDAHSTIDQSDSEIIEIDEVMDIEDEEQNRGERFNNGLRNIFEEYDNNNFSWNDLNVYDMH